ncbi:putative C6 transcription factor [Hypoxylon sp. FL0543]|nr:putative C6 transcription factor [Hypoxylon sp. FL0543]
MTEPEPERRRRRPPLSCTLCRRRKLRCSRESPCSNCVKSRSGNCIYDNYAPHPRDRTAEHALGGPYLEPHYSTPPGSATSILPCHTSRSPPKAASSATVPAADKQSSQEIESLRSQIRQLEEQLAKATRTSSRPTASTSDSNIEAVSSRISGTFYVQHEDRSTGESQAIPRCVTHKTRVFGQSHWITGFALVRNLITIFEPYVRDENSRISLLMEKSKSLARSIKSRRSPKWPSPPVNQLPPKDVADELVDRYLRTSETIYRILHVPTFKKDYEAYWVSQTEPNTAFLVQLKLVLAIGATTYDEHFSLRPSAMKWVYEAQTWISEPGFKHRLNLQYLQTHILLLLAREAVDVSPDLVWISAGSLLRTAMYMGLHKDPKRLPKTTMFTTEMRRRLWNTIIELSLQLSLTSGGPPLISLDTFDAEPPGNFDDEQIANEDAIPKPEAEFTQTSTAIAIRKTFPARLAVAKFLNDPGSHGTYRETLRHDNELRTAYKALLKTFQGYKSNPGPRPSEFEMDVVSLFINRFLLSLHTPFFAPAMHEAAYAFSRKVIIETSLKIWRAVYSSSTSMNFHTYSDASSDRNYLSRLAVCASGFFRIVAMQASVHIVTEVIEELQEEDTLGPGLVRQDLLSILDETKDWSWQCIEAGETSIKGYFLACLLAAQVEGLMQGLSTDDLAEFLINILIKAEERCIPALEEMAARYRTESTADGPEHTPSTTQSQLLEDWDLAMSDALFDFNAIEPINWAFNESSQGTQLFC